MREILFRGFTPDERGKKEIVVNGKKVKGEWVQGSYWKLKKTTYCFKEDYDAHPDNTEHYIVFSQMTDWGLPNQQLKADVLPETVGQYTGFTDKNGKKVFEGDILKNGFGGIRVVVFMNARFILKNTDNNMCSSWAYMDKHEIVGNIHDSPKVGAMWR